MNKETFIKDISVSMGLSEDIISKVIAFQGEDALKAVKVYDEIEFSGLGKFYLSQIKLNKILKGYEKGLERMKSEEIPDTVRIERLEKVIEDLKKRRK